MATWTVFGESGTAAGGDGPIPVLAATDIATVTGWTPKPQGWCRGDECIPNSVVSDAARTETLSLDELAETLGTAAAVDETHRLAVVGTRLDSGSTIEGGIAPDLELPGLDGEHHRLFEHTDGKTLVVAFASWCGCRHDLPGWQAVRDELAGQRFDVVGVAIDESVDDVEPWVDGIDFPVLVDTDRTFADAYALTNVPSLLWLDEQHRVVRQPAPEFPDDTFTEVHGVESGPHLDALRRWVLDDELPPPPDVDPSWSGNLDSGQIRARAEFRLAVELLRRGHTGAAGEHLATADELAPDDFTIWRAGMQLVGEDPFGAEFFERYVDYQRRHGGPLSGA